MFHQCGMEDGSKLDMLVEKRNSNVRNANKQNGGQAYLDLIFARFVARRWTRRANHGRIYTKPGAAEKMPEMQILGIHERRKMEMLPLSADRGTQSGRGPMPKVCAEKKGKGG